MSVNYKLILSQGFGMPLLILEMKVKKGKPQKEIAFLLTVFSSNLLLADTNYYIKSLDNKD